MVIFVADSLMRDGPFHDSHGVDKCKFLGRAVLHGATIHNLGGDGLIVLHEGSEAWGEAFKVPENIEDELLGSLRRFYGAACPMQEVELVVDQFKLNAHAFIVKPTLYPVLEVEGPGQSNWFNRVPRRMWEDKRENERVK